MAKKQTEEQKIKRGPGRPRKVVSDSEAPKKEVKALAKPKVEKKKVVTRKKATPKKPTVKKAITTKEKKESGENEKNTDHLFKPQNQLWQLRSKDGRDKEFSTPLDLWERAIKYFAWTDNNPFIKEEWKSSGGILQKVETRHLKPYTLIGMCIYLNVSSSYFRHFKSIAKKELKEGVNVELNNDFITVIEKLEEIIYNQKYEGAASNFLNANIIARDLGLSDKIETTEKADTEGKTIDELKEELEKLRKWEK